MEQDIPYRFNSSETGIFVEIYLPKKARFQGTLHDTLTKGFNPTYVKKHFQNQKKRERINQLLEKYERITSYTSEMIDGLEEVFFGYSIYEVDGVFLKTSRNYPENKGAKRSKRKSVIMEERTQIIRVLFKPDLGKFLKEREDRRKDLECLTREYLRRSGTHDLFIESHSLDELQMEVVAYLRKWVGDVGLFLFGYIVYEICARILNLFKKGKIDLDQVEDEIWVTSWWNLVINKIKFEQSDSG